ncbi:MAG: histidine kinase [Desulfosarcina sp.]|jgi:PAS domain S-box-containing protein
MPEKTQPDDWDILNFRMEAPYFQALYKAPIPILIAREDGLMLMTNHAFQAATGFSHEEIPTIQAWAGHVSADSETGPVSDLFNFLESDKSLGPLRIILKKANGESLIWELFNAPLGQTSDGHRMAIVVATDVTQAVEHTRHMHSAMNRLEDEVSEKTRDLNTTITSLANEIVERKHMGDALSVSRKRLKTISRRTLDVLEADRRTISKELHDSIGASLAAIKFSLEEKEMQREQNQGRLDESLDQEIAHLMATIKETKRISANLRPTTLDDLGLLATIKWYLRQFQRLYEDIRVEYRTEVAEQDVPEPMKIIIYRIVQEGLSNAQKHSEASSVRLQMEFSDGNRSISLLIEDDGRGFDVEEILSEKDPLSGYGLTAMRERCEIYGGSFHIHSRIGQGTRINAILPI